MHAVIDREGFVTGGGVDDITIGGNLPDDASIGEIVWKRLPPILIGDVGIYSSWQVDICTVLDEWRRSEDQFLVGDIGEFVDSNCCPEVGVPEGKGLVRVLIRRVA